MTDLCYAIDDLNQVISVNYLCDTFFIKFSLIFGSYKILIFIIKQHRMLQINHNSKTNNS